jgi:4,5-DOPA dioxygenase extradiol
MTTHPSLFLAHGAPDLPLTDHVAKRFLASLSGSLPAPRAILIVSAHWEAAAPTLTTSEAPRTVHDFMGWPGELYKITYPAKTDAALIARAGGLLAEAGIAVAEDPRRGYDHGAWVPLSIAYPLAEVPVVQLSLERGGDARRHFEIGRALAPLRAEGVLIVGSGATVHNLRRLAPEGSPPPGWASEFDGWLHDRLGTRDLETLLSFPAQPQTARMAHPTDEHFLPLYVAMGAGWDGGAARRMHASYSYGSVGMACYAFGTAGEVALGGAEAAA